MDPFTAFALTVVIVAAGLYALYWVVRKGVAAGIRDADVENASQHEH